MKYAYNKQQNNQGSINVNKPESYKDGHGDFKHKKVIINDLILICSQCQHSKLKGRKNCKGRKQISVFTSLCSAYKAAFSFASFSVWHGGPCMAKPFDSLTWQSVKFCNRQRIIQIHQSTEKRHTKPSLIQKFFLILYL